MRNHLITFIFLLVASFAFGQKHEFYLQVMPHVGTFKNYELEERDSIGSGVNTGWVSSRIYYPFASLSIGIQSKSRLFYQVQCGAQFARLKHFFYSVEVDDQGALLPSQNGTSFYTLEFGARVYPTLALSLGYHLSENNRILMQSSLWSYSLGFEYTKRYFALGINGGKMFDLIANKLLIGPGLRDGVSKDFYWLEKDSGYLFSAYINFNLSSVFGKNNTSNDNSDDSNKGVPKEF